jgi:hypothetical protein
VSEACSPCEEADLSASRSDFRQPSAAVGLMSVCWRFGPLISASFNTHWA